jgi:hypothetical protein
MTTDNSSTFLPLNENIIVLNNTNNTNCTNNTNNTYNTNNANYANNVNNDNNTNNTNNANNEKNYITKYGFIAKRSFEVADETEETNFILKGVVVNTGFNCINLNTGSNVKDFYKDMVIRFDSGKSCGSTRCIKKYCPTEHKIFLDKDLKTAVSYGDKFTIFDKLFVGFLFDEKKDEFIFKSFQNKDDQINSNFKNIHANSGYFDSEVTALSLSTLSDKRLKKNIKNLEYKECCEYLDSIKGVSFDWKKNNRNIDKNKKQIGFIAQDIEKILPNIVTKGRDGIRGVQYDKIIPVLLEVVKGLNKRVEELETKIKNMKSY